MPAAGTGFQASTTQKPPFYPGPHNFLMLSIITTIICGILNLVSLAFGIPSIVLASLVRCSTLTTSHKTIFISHFPLYIIKLSQGMSAKNSGNYPKAKKYGNHALILVICNVIFTLSLTLLVIGSVTAYADRDRPRCTRLYYSVSKGWCKFSTVKSR